MNVSVAPKGGLNSNIEQRLIRSALLAHCGGSNAVWDYLAEATGINDIRSSFDNGLDLPHGCVNPLRLPRGFMFGEVDIVGNAMVVKGDRPYPNFYHKGDEIVGERLEHAIGQALLKNNIDSTPKEWLAEFGDNVVPDRRAAVGVFGGERPLPRGVLWAILEKLEDMAQFGPPLGEAMLFDPEMPIELVDSDILDTGGDDEESDADADTTEDASSDAGPAAGTGTDPAEGSDTVTPPDDTPPDASEDSPTQAAAAPNAVAELMRLANEDMSPIGVTVMQIMRDGNNMSQGKLAKKMGENGLKPDSQSGVSAWFTGRIKVTCTPDHVRVLCEYTETMADALLKRVLTFDTHQKERAEAAAAAAAAEADANASAAAEAKAKQARPNADKSLPELAEEHRKFYGDLVSAMVDYIGKLKSELHRAMVAKGIIGDHVNNLYNLLTGKGPWTNERVEFSCAFVGLDVDAVRSAFLDKLAGKDLVLKDLFPDIEPEQEDPEDDLDDDTGETLAEAGEETVENDADRDVDTGADATDETELDADDADEMEPETVTETEETLAEAGEETVEEDADSDADTEADATDEAKLDADDADETEPETVTETVDVFAEVNADTTDTEPENTEEPEAEADGEMVPDVNDSPLALLENGEPISNLSAGEAGMLQMTWEQFQSMDESQCVQTLMGLVQSASIRDELVSKFMAMLLNAHANELEGVDRRRFLGSLFQASLPGEPDED